MTDLLSLASDLVARALRSGATAADAIAREGSEFSTNVRMGQVETLKEAAGRAVGLRVFLGKNVGSTYTSDLSADGINHLVDGALSLAKITSEDPNAGLPDAKELGSLPGNLDLYHDDVTAMPSAERIEWARRAEKAALAVDPRLNNSEGGSFGANRSRMALANSLGFAGEYRSSSCSVSAVPIAKAENGSMQRDGWSSVARTVSKLQSPEEVGKIAAQRTLRRLGARKIASTRVPIIFDSLTAEALLGHLFDSVNGDLIYRGASFLAGKLGEKIAGENVTIIDDGTMAGGFGTSPFDGEGVPSQRTVVIERGVLKSYLLNTYIARKLKLKTTGSAARSVTGNPGIGCGNFFLEPGTQSPQELIAGVKEGLYVTDFLGSGVNLVTGDFSRGAGGQWIQNGELTYPVEEITVAGNLRDMLTHISGIANDLEWRGSVACPTIRIDGMQIAGE